MAANFKQNLMDTWELDDCEPFVQEEVLPLLDCCNARMTWLQLTERLPAWVAGFGESVRIATDAVAADWVWIQKICYATGPWPRNLSHQPLALPSGVEEFDRAREQTYETGSRHHALDDAKAARSSWLAIKNDLAR